MSVGTLRLNRRRAEMAKETPVFIPEPVVTTEPEADPKEESKPKKKK